MPKTINYTDHLPAKGEVGATYKGCVVYIGQITRGEHRYDPAIVEIFKKDPELKFAFKGQYANKKSGLVNLEGAFLSYEEAGLAVKAAIDAL